MFVSVQNEWILFIINIFRKKLKGKMIQNSKDISLIVQCEYYIISGCMNVVVIKSAYIMI